MTIELDGWVKRYNEEFRFKSVYNQLLRERVMVALSPVLGEENMDSETRQHLEEILSGQSGKKVTLSTEAVKALYEAQLLHSHSTCNFENDKPGWKHFKNPPKGFEGPFRTVAYFVVLPGGFDTRDGHSAASVGINLEALWISLDEQHDFTSWILERK